MQNTLIFMGENQNLKNVSTIIRFVRWVIIAVEHKESLLSKRNHGL